jgi:hypothetical protein
MVRSQQQVSNLDLLATQSSMQSDPETANFSGDFQDDAKLYKEKEVYVVAFVKYLRVQSLLKTPGSMGDYW